MFETRTLRRRGAPRSLVSTLITSVLAASGLAAVLLGVVAGPAGAASASLGSVPADVTAYVSSGAMVARLNDVYGPNASGTKGIAFDAATTKAGPISRVYEWTAARLANQATDHPVQLTNNWVVPITIGEKSVGLATIWINPQTVEPELAQFTPGPALGTALTTVPATAALVRDTATGAWLALADAKVTPLVAGTSGLTTPAPVASLTLSTAAATPISTAAEPNTGLALAIGLVGLIVVVIVVGLLLPRGRRARTTRKTAGDAEAASASAASAPEPATHDEPVPTPVVPAPTPVVKKTVANKPAVRKPAPLAATSATPAATGPTGRASTPKPTGARPSGRTPTNSAASKPATSRPGATKPSAAKPPVSKPPAPKQPPRPRAPRQKPPAADSGTASDS
ncbi:MAG TPA: hypothetical protein VGM70_10260 [Pseudolysinimonas sp.]|jgi:hypothetical protein